MDSNFRGVGKNITDVDIPRIGSLIGVGEDEIHAFMDVEAGGSPWDSQGRPKMLFEPHKFYANLSGAKRAAAVKAGLAYPRWGTKPYPSDSYPRLKAAVAIDREAALSSASWGLTQILGTYYADLGYATASAMVEAFADDAAAHLEATVLLLKKWGVDDDLRAHRWAVVAKTWNGSGYAKNSYDKKLAASFAKWQKIKDTKWPPADYAPPAVAMVAIPVADAAAAQAADATTDAQDAMMATVKSYTDRTHVEVVQRKLKLDLGYTEVGNLDGKMGGNTETAILAFRKDNDLPLVPIIDDQLLAAIDTAKPRVLSPARTDATPAQVAASAPEVTTSWRNKIAGLGGMGTGGLLLGQGALENLGVAKGYLDNISGYFAAVPGWGWGLAALAVAGFIWYNAQKGEAITTDAYKTGARR